MSLITDLASKYLAAFGYIPKAQEATKEALKNILTSRVTPSYYGTKGFLSNAEYNAARDLLGIDYADPSTRGGGGSKALGGGTGGGGRGETPKAVPEPTSTTGAGTSSTPAPSNAAPDYSHYLDRIAQLEYELAHPKVYSAAEIAEHFGLTDEFNEQNILNRLNTATNDYYNSAVAEQDKLRTQYLRNNNQYLNNIINGYLNSYNNAAPTAVGRGVLAANLLNTQLQGSHINSQNDYGMLQSINALEEARKAELANNPKEARDKYNNMATYFSDISVNHNASDVKQYVDKLTALSNMYAADRAYQQSLADAAATKYSGLAGAAATNAQTTANSYNANNFQRLWDYYYSTTGNAQTASKKVSTFIQNQQGKVGD